jgi:hypothetical protein
MAAATRASTIATARQGRPATRQSARDLALKPGLRPAGAAARAVLAGRPVWAAQIAVARGSASSAAATRPPRCPGPRKRRRAPQRPRRPRDRKIQRGGKMSPGFGKRPQAYVPYPVSAGPWPG